MGIKRKRRIFLGAQEISGMMERLNNAFHDMGIESDFYCIPEYAFDLGKKDLPVLRKFRIHTKKKKYAVGERAKAWWSFLQMWDILRVFVYALFRYDCFIYIYGNGIFFHNRYLRKIEEVEFFILKLFRKKMVMWLCGSDSRPLYCDGANYYSDIEKIYSITREKAAKIKMLEKYMDLIDYSPSSHFHTKPYLIFNCIGIPVDIKEKVRIDKKNVDKVRILHAPSDQKAKGTVIVRNIVKEMQEEGYDFEYMEVSGLPHRVVLEKMAMSDIVVDQVYSDTPMAGFATEVAINGVPVVVGGYYAEVYKKVLPDPIAPTVYCNPKELKEKIIYLIEHEEERIRIGEKERAYVEGHCLAETVANKFLRIFDHSYPKEWIMNPSDNDYIWGYGQSREAVANEITRLIDRYGTEALCLDKNGILYKKYVQLYNDTKAGNRVKEGI